MKFAGWQGYRKITVKKNVSWIITAGGQRNLCTVSGIRWYSAFSISLFSLYHICAPAKSCYLFICSDSGNYPFLLNLTAKSLRVDQGMGMMSFDICYCILVHLCGWAPSQCTPSAHLTSQQAWCISSASWWVYHLLFQHNLIFRTIYIAAKCKGKAELEGHSALQEGVEMAVFGCGRRISISEGSIVFLEAWRGGRKAG